MKKTYDLITLLRDTNEWEELWDSVEQEIAKEFLSTNNPLQLHTRLQSLRELRIHMENIK